jgi:flagellar motor switch/type III secretory pathway protein FliN
MEQRPKPKPASSEAQPKPSLIAPAQGRWASLLLLPCTLSVDLAVSEVTVADLLGLEVGSIINSRHPENSPLPVWVNGVTVGWAEFDAVGKHMAVRITEIS